MNDDNDRPTLPAWAVGAITELTEQIERLATGNACRECRGAGTTSHAGKVGSYFRECHECRGSGFKTK